MNSSDTSPPAPGPLSITEVERLTGLRQATLRMWERRYGFPQPLRDRHGDRIYPPEQVARLQAAQRLIQAGARPGRLFAGAAGLAALPPPAPAELSARQQLLVGLLRDYRVADLHAQFQFRLMDLGLRRFVGACLAPLARAVDAAGRAGELPPRSLHLFTQLASAFLQARLATVRDARDNWPRAVLATTTGAAGILDLIMAEAVLTALEVDCIQLGANLAAQEIGAAAAETGAGIVVLGLGADVPRRAVVREALAVRAALAPQVALWVGAPGAAPGLALPPGASLAASPDSLASLLATWRTRARADAH